MDSSGLGACLSIHNKISAKKGALAFINPSEIVKKIFRLTSADKTFVIHKSISEVEQNNTIIWGTDHVK